MALALLEQPCVATRLVADLRVQRTDVALHNVAPDRVQLSVTVTNEGLARSAPTTMTLQAAPFGAFVPWRDLTTLAVPSIEPGDRVQVTTEFAAPAAKSLGQFSRVPPRRLITALASEDRNAPRPPARRGILSLLFQPFRRPAPPSAEPALPPDPMQLLSRPGVHWAGNINVHLNGHAIERHMAQALRIYPGRTNLAIFILGDRTDEYRFALAGNGASWDTALHYVGSHQMLTSARSTFLHQSRWIRLDRFSTILVTMFPPEHCEVGSLDIEVCQRSTGKTAIVEFTLDARAAGTGCYTV
jgi:hypothetical protein